MRIGMFSDYYLSQADGTAIAVEISRAGLEEAGHQVYIYCPRVPGTPHGKRIISYYSMPAFIYSNLRACWPFSRSTLAGISQRNLDVIHIHTPFLVGLSGLRAAKKLKKPLVITAHLDMDFLRSYPISLVAMTGLAFLTGMICRQPGQFVRTIFQPRRRPPNGWRRDLAWRSFGFLAQQCDLVLAPSKKIYDQLSGHCSPDKLRLVPNGVDMQSAALSKKEARAKLGISPDAFVVINLSRHVREKKIETIIYSFLKLQRSVPHAELYLLGSGPRHRKLKGLASALDIETKLHFCGTMPHEKVFDYLAAADVYVNACMREVASLSVFEAANNRLPLILSDHRLVEPLVEGENGFFAVNAEQIGEKLIWFAQHPMAATKMGAASVRRVRKAFSTTQHLKALQEAYRQI